MAKVILNHHYHCDVQYLVVAWAMLADNIMSMRKNGMQIEGLKMKLQTYLVEVKN